MIIQYDTRPDATIDEKLRSLIESIQLALGEVGIREDINITSQSAETEALSVLIREVNDAVSSIADAITGVDGRVDTLEDTTIPGIQNEISGLDGRLDAAEGAIDTINDTTIPALDSRVTTLEGRQALPTAPGTDGAYVLTVTVADGIPTYTWELA